MFVVDVILVTRGSFLKEWIHPEFTESNWLIIQIHSKLKDYEFKTYLHKRILHNYRFLCEFKVKLVLVEYWIDSQSTQI